MEQENKQQIPTENPNREQDAIRKLLLLREHINNDNPESEDLMGTLKQLQDVYKELGGYLLTPTAELFPRAMDYFNANIDKVRAFLSNSGVTNETVEAVTQDYGGVLMGQYTYRATPVQMLEVLKKIKPYRAYLADKYVLYYAVMKQYATTVELAAKFNDAFRHDGATPDTKRAFMDGQYSPTGALCLQSLHTRRFFTVQDFDGIEREQVINWLDNLEAYANVGKYAVYYSLANLVLSASTEQLQEINAPELLTVTAEDFGVHSAQEYANRYTDFVRRKVEEMTAQVDELLAAENEQARREAEDWKSKTNTDIIRVPQNFALIQSRDLYGARDGENAKDILPISAFIEHYLKGKDITLSPYIAERAIQGVNLLQRFHNVKPENGRYTFHTNISEFAAACGYNDANDTLKKQLLAALLLLNDLYVVVWKPKGRTAIKVITVQEIGLSGDIRGDLKIEVTAEAMKGRPNLIAYNDIKKLQQAGKGAAQHHFNGQILSKGHKVEDALLDEIFGYTARIDEAMSNNATEDEIKEIRTYIRKKKPTHKKTLLRMFEKAQADGVITYQRYTNKKGETVYKWERVKEPEQTQEPDEQ